MDNAKKGLDSNFNLFAQWMDKFVKILKKKKVLSPLRKHLVVPDGYNSHITLEVIIKAKEYGIDLLTLSLYTSCEL